MPRSEKRVATTAADPVCSLGRPCAIGRGSGIVAPVLTDRHRSGFAGAANLGACHGAAVGERELSDAEVRARLSAMSDDELARVLTPAEREALEFGYRERVTDTEHAHIRSLPEVLPTLFADAAARAEQAGFDGVELHYA